MRLALAIVSAVSALILSSCETMDSGYGYMANGLDEDSIFELFALSDEAVNTRQLEVYQGLFGPGFYILDKTDDFSMAQSRIGRFEYFEFVERVFREAKELVVYSEVLEIDFVEPGVRAVVIAQEEQRLHYAGDNKRVVSRVEIEVGFDDGWIFFESSVTTAKQEIKE